MELIDKIENKNIHNLDFLDYIRVFASFIVIIMHVMINFINDFQVPGHVFNSIVNFNMFANYLFFMLTGYSSMKYDKDISIKQAAILVIKRYIGLIFFAIPFSFIESFWKNKLVFSSLMIKNAIIGGLLSTNTWDHLWFMYMLLAVYILMPFLIKIYKNKDNRLLLAFTIFLFLLAAFKYKIWLRVPIKMLGRLPFSHIILCVTLGAFMYRYNVLDRIHLVFYVIIILLMTYIWFKMYFVVSFIGGDFYLIIFSIFMFELFSKIFKRKSEVIFMLASHNYIIYLIHVFFLHMITKFAKINLYKPLGMLGLILTVIIVYVLSLCSAIVIEKIPYIGRLYSKNK